MLGPAIINRSLPCTHNSRIPKPPSCRKCLRYNCPSASIGLSCKRVGSLASNTVSSSSNIAQPRNTGPRKPTNNRSPTTARPSISKPLSLPGITRKSCKCGSAANACINTLPSGAGASCAACKLWPFKSSVRSKPGIAVATLTGIRASKKRLSSRLTVCRRLLFSNADLLALTFLRLRLCEPTNHRYWPLKASPSISISSPSSAPAFAGTGKDRKFCNGKRTCCA